MDVHGPGKNVKLRVDYITRAMLGNVPDLLIDLLEVAAYVYCADQRLWRGSDKLTNFGEDWRRHLHFSVPVRHPEVWRQPDVQDLLAEVLGFLSDDSYVFEFHKARAPRKMRELYFPNLIDASLESDEIALFSGGVDSFGGAVEDIVINGKAVTLVGHYSAAKVQNVQSSLIDAVKQRGFGRQVAYIPVWVSNEGIRAREFSQRTRSFLFACLGLVMARMSGRNQFTFYENGVVSINLPIGGDVVGARATRTTHPKVLRGLEDLFSVLLDRTIQIRTPLQWLTKKEVILKIRDAGMGDLLAMTTSCTRPRSWAGRQKHCGECSQCIDRRFAVLGAGMAENDPAEGYKVDLLMGDRSMNGSLRMALSYVACFKGIGATTKERFLVKYPEVVSALNHFRGVSTEEASDRLHHLFQRQAQTVEAVIADGLVQHAGALYRGEVPSGSLLALCTTRGHIETRPSLDYDAQAKAFMDRLAEAVLEFAIDAGHRRVVFRGGLAITGTNFQLVEALIEDFQSAKAEDRDVPFMPATTLAEKLGISEQSLRQQLRRLRKELEPLAVALGVPMDQHTFIETKERAGYRLNPTLRQIALRDIRTDHFSPLRA